MAEALQNVDTYSTADDIFARIFQNGKKVSYSTVYNNLNWLVERGFAEKIICPNERAIYRIIS